jgi:hypothetical protein
MARDARHGWNRQTAAELAWREAKASADVHHLLGEVCRGTVRPPAGFVAVELGFGLLEGPSIIATMQDLDKTNRAHKRQLAKGGRPARPRMTGARAQRAVRALVAGARTKAA